MDPLKLAYVLIALGALLLLAELLIPTGVLFIFGVVVVIIGVALTFLHGETSTGFITLISVFLALPLGGSILFWLYPKTPFGRQTLLPPSENMTVAEMPGNAEMKKYRGRIGKTVSPLRPSGVVDFDGRRVDSISEGIMVEVGRWVRCLDVKAGKVIVREIEEPKVTDFEATDFG